jgi:hypothetical protein
MVDKKTQLQAMPISNSEVIKLIRKQYSQHLLGDGGYEGHYFGNEQGIELRKQTVDYIELFNETELEETNTEIRR